MLPFDPVTVHAHRSEDLEELAAGFAVGALDDREGADIVRHLGVCAVCRGLVSEFRAVADALPESLEPRQASEGLKERIMASVRLEATTAPAAATRPAAPVPFEPAMRRWAWALPASLAAAAVLVALLGASIVWDLSLKSRNDEQTERLARQEQVLDAIAAGGRTVRLKGTKDAPDASGTVVQSPDGRTAFLLVRDLPKLPAGREYQVWRIKDAKPVGAGLFVSEGLAEQLVALSADFTDADAIGISIEPRGGSLAPTGAIVLLGG